MQALEEYERGFAKMDQHIQGCQGNTAEVKKELRNALHSMSQVGLTTSLSPTVLFANGLCFRRSTRGLRDASRRWTDVSKIVRAIWE